MATYGRGQMLGSGINPESFKLDYSGMANAAATQAQGMANLGASIGGAIKDFGEAREQRKKIDAETKASRAGIESAIKLGDALGFDVKGMLSPVLAQMDDPNTTPMEAAALGREASSQIANVLNLGFKAQDQNLEKARLTQDAAYKAEQLKIATQNATSRALSAIAEGGNAPSTIDMPLGDGSSQRMQWDRGTQSYIPIQVSGLGDSQAQQGTGLTDLVKGFEGFNPKAYNDYKQTSIGYGTKGEPGETITEEEASNRLQTELAVSAERIKKAAEIKKISLNENQFNALTSFDYNTGRGANLIERFGDQPDQLAAKMLEYTKAGGKDLPGLVKRRQIEAALFLSPDQQAAATPQSPIGNRGRIGFTPAKPQATSRIVTGEEAKRLGGDPEKEYIVVNENKTITRISPSSSNVIERNTKAYEQARSLYEQGDRLGALNILRALKARDVFGDITDESLDAYMKSNSSNSSTPSTSVDDFDLLSPEKKREYLDSLTPEERKELLDRRLNTK